jgi:hypothetical protein
VIDVHAADLERLPERLRSHISIGGVDDCWPWTASLSKGYGYTQVVSRQKPVTGSHRMTYEILIGPIPPGFTLDHLCHNRDLSCPGGDACLHRRCCNPAHLDPCSMAENQARSELIVWKRNALKTHCNHGHEFTAQNTYDNRGRRNCMECARRRRREYDARQRAVAR